MFSSDPNDVLSVNEPRVCEGNPVVNYRLDSDRTRLDYGEFGIKGLVIVKNKKRNFGSFITLVKLF